MSNSDTRQRDEQVASYLRSMRTLQSEMAGAMKCIAANALPGLQECIARQEVLCAELAAQAKRLNGPTPSPEQSWLREVDPTVASEVRNTSAALQQTNCQYAALLKHSGRTFALLSSLCNVHTGYLQEARGSRTKYQTWSCEM